MLDSELGIGKLKLMELSCGILALYADMLLGVKDLRKIKGQH